MHANDIRIVEQKVLSDDWYPVSYTHLTLPTSELV